MDRLARLRLVERRAGLDDPVGQAIAAEPRQTHQLDVLGIVAVAQMADETAEGRSGVRIVELVERIGHDQSLG